MKLLYAEDEKSMSEAVVDIQACQMMGYFGVSTPL